MPAAAVAIPTVISGIASVGQMISGNDREKDAQKSIDEYERQNLINPYEGLQVSTLGADRQREDLSRTITTTANNSMMGGSRSMIALTPQLIAQQNQQEAQIMANLDEQEKQRQQLIAKGNEMVQSMQEKREGDDLTGLGTNLNVARQEKINGLNNLTQTGIGFGKLVSSGVFNKK